MLEGLHRDRGGRSHDRTADRVRGRHSGLIWWAITLIPLPSPGGLVAHVVLSIAMVVALLGYVLPMIHMPSTIQRL
jgi:hypothetical protein